MDVLWKPVQVYSSLFAFAVDVNLGRGHISMGVSELAWRET